MLSELLQFVDCSFITAEDGETAITLAQQYHPNMILLDMMLPGISGVEVVKSLQQDSRTRDIPIVAVTAIARAENQKQFLESGCLECVTKPYSIDELENIIHCYLPSKN